MLGCSGGQLFSDEKDTYHSGIPGLKQVHRLGLPGTFGSAADKRHLRDLGKHFHPGVDGTHPKLFLPPLPLQACSIETLFRTSNYARGAYLEEMGRQQGQLLRQPVETRWGSKVDCLQSVIANRITIENTLSRLRRERFEVCQYICTRTHRFFLCCRMTHSDQ